MPWTDQREVVAELKRANRLPEALDRIRECAEAAGRVGVLLDEAPDPWPTEQAGIVLRKLKDPAGERAWLEAYAIACGTHPVPEKLMIRLDSLRAQATS
jgi:hypothetical protein